jgi:hypothetical protein
LRNSAKWDGGKSKPENHNERRNTKMSHFTTIQTQVRDLDALRAALGELGVTLLANTDARGYAANKLKGDYVIRLKGPYDIALNKTPDDSYGLTTDWWDGHVEKEVGSQFGRLLQLYGVHKTMIESRKKGHMVQRKAQKDGSIKLVIGGVS